MRVERFKYEVYIYIIVRKFQHIYSIYIYNRRVVVWLMSMSDEFLCDARSCDDDM